MTENLSNPNEAWRNFTRRIAIEACKLQMDDLKRLYRILNEKQFEHRDRVMAKLSCLENETTEQFGERKNKVHNSFITTVSITGVNGDVVMGHGEAIFDSAELPEKIISILYDTSFSPQAQIQYNPSDKISLLLDFSHPALLDLSNAPAAPTPNNSNYNIIAETDSWARSLSSKLNEFFGQKATNRNWLHQVATYDWLLLLLACP